MKSHQAEVGPVVTHPEEEGHNSYVKITLFLYSKLAAMRLCSLHSRE